MDSITLSRKSKASSTEEEYQELAKIVPQATMAEFYTRNESATGQYIFKQAYFMVFYEYQIKD